MFDGDTLESAKEWLRKQVVQKGARCPCCNQFAKIYKRKLLYRAVVVLVDLYRYDLQHPNEFVHVNTLQGMSDYPEIYQSGDKTLSHNWGLIISPKSTEDKRRSGLWKITGKGIDFLLGRKPIPKYVYLYNDTVLKFSTERAMVDEVCGKFSWSEIMESVE